MTTIAELAKKVQGANLPLHADGLYAMEYPGYFPEDGYPCAHQVFTFGTQGARVLVDIETGVVTVEDLTLVQDAGSVINPHGALGQLEGGAAMGVGYALFEELLTDGGRTLNDSFEGY